ncbi:hypothetical protein YC2023_093687 [Brassica napus]
MQVLIQLSESQRSPLAKRPLQRAAYFCIGEEKHLSKPEIELAESQRLIINLIQLVLFIFVRPVSRNVYRRTNTSVVELLWLQLIWLVDWWAFMKINLYADAEALELLGKEHALVLSNHRGDIDWLVGWVMAQRSGCLGSTLAIMRKEAKYFPIIGWSMWFSEYIFLEKNWAKDEKILKAGFNQLKDFPTTLWLGLFVEGTRFNQANLEAAKNYASLKGLPTPRSVLIPRTKVDKKQTTPTLLRMFSGQSSEVNLQMRRYKMSQLPETADGIAQWCQNLFVAKDAQLENYFTNDVFSDLDVHQIGRPIKPLIHQATSVILHGPDHLFLCLFLGGCNFNSGTSNPIFLIKGHSS